MAYPYTWTADVTTITVGGYCAIEDVELLFKNISGYSQLDAEEIQRRIGDATVEIDRTVELNYIVPVTADAPALAILRLICARLAAAIINETYYVAEEPVTLPGQWRLWAEAQLQKIVSGEITFATAPRALSTSLPEIPSGKGATFNPDNDADLNPDAGPLFSRGNRGDLGALGDVI